MTISVETAIIRRSCTFTPASFKFAELTCAAALALPGLSCSQPYHGVRVQAVASESQTESTLTYFVCGREDSGQSLSRPRVQLLLDAQALLDFTSVYAQPTFCGKKLV